MEIEQIETKTEIEAESFQKIVEDSKADLAAEAEAQIKRGRGRPPGSKNKKGVEPETQTKTQAKKVEVDVLPDGRPPVDLKPLLKDGTKIPFKVAAIKYDEPELEVDDKDVETPTYYLDRLLNFHLPGLEKKDPKTFAMWLFAISMLILGIKKFVVATEKRKQNQQSPNESRHEGQEVIHASHSPAPAASNSPLPGRGASEFFRGRS